MHVPVCVECMWCECTCMRVYVCVHLHLHSETTDLVSKLVYHFTTAFHTTKCQQQYGFRDKRRKKQTTLTGYTCRWDQCKEDDGFQALAGPPQSGLGRWSGTRPWSVLPAQSRSNDIRDEHFIPAKQNTPLTQQCCFWHLEQSPPRYQALCYFLFLQKQTQDISLLGIFQLSNIVLHPSQSVQCVHACVRVPVCAHIYMLVFVKLQLTFSISTYIMCVMFVQHSAARPTWWDTTLLWHQPDKWPPCWETTQTKDHPAERPPWQVTTLMGDHHERRPPRSDHPDEIPSWQETTLTKDHLAERPLWQKTTLLRDHPAERPPWQVTTPMRCHPAERPTWQETTLMSDHPERRPPWQVTTLRR